MEPVGETTPGPSSDGGVAAVLGRLGGIAHALTGVLSLENEEGDFLGSSSDMAGGDISLSQRAEGLLHAWHLLLLLLLESLGHSNSFSLLKVMALTCFLRLVFMLHGKFSCPRVVNTLTI